PQGDVRLHYWIHETKRKRKRVEGHLPGASEKTLTKLKLLGASADHEPMTGEEVLNRLRLGYHVPLRYSSIRPDLPKLLDEILELELDVFDQLTYTTDGSSPVFMEKGVINLCIDIAIKKGIPLIDAYRMATYNVAKCYGLDEVIGSIAPGRLAHLNILYEKDDPTPLSVIAKGQWIVKEGIECKPTVNIDWKKYGIDKLKLDWDLTDDDLQFSIPVGMEMMNDVILKPYPIEVDITVSNISSDNFDAFLLLIDRDGKWRVNTMLKGFVKSLGGLCSTFSTTDDIIIIGKRKADMRLAFERTKEIGGGIVLAHEGKIIYELPLALSGAMSTEDLETLISQVNGLIDTLKRYGYELSDPMYNLFFLSSMHLPYIRVTPKGIIDVMKRETIVPANMR